MAINKEWSGVSNHSEVFSNEKTETEDIPYQLKPLDPQVRQVIEVLFFKGMSQQSASEYLDIPLGTVKSTRTTTRKRFR